MDAITLMLMLWIGDHTNYDTATIQAPDIVELSAKELTREAYTDKPDKIPEGGIDERIYALYSFDASPNGTIYIKYAHTTEGSERYSDSADNPIFQERLLHELVHHIQKHSGVYDKMPCRNISEKEAYLLGGQFLQQHKTKDPLPNRTLIARMVSRC